MKIAMVYIYPMAGAGHYLDLAVRFIESYHQCPPGMDHDSVVVCNGAKTDDATRFLFGSLPNLRFIEHDNSGYDCGGYQRAARDHPCDLMVFFGASTYLKRPGWMIRVKQSWELGGPGLYGVMGNRGDDRFGVYPHIRSTGFWTSPKLMNEYPMKITRPEQRYPFEHGPMCLTSWIKQKGLIPWVVSWSGQYKWEYWDSFPNGFHRGDQSDMLAGDKNSCPPYYHCA